MASFNIHNPMVVFIFGILGNLVSFLVFIAPMPTFYHICKKKSTEGFHFVPYMVALFSSMLWVYYALVKSNEMLLITINSFGCFVETVYIAVYVAYAPKRARMQALKVFSLLIFCGFGSILVFIHFFVKRSKQVRVLGWISVFLSASVFIAPLSIMKQVIRTKSVEFMPISLSWALVFSAVMWFFYGLLLKDFYIAVPNIVGLIFGVLQIILYTMYKGSKPETQENMPTTIANPKTCEIHPVCFLPIDQRPEITIIDDENASGATHDQPKGKKDIVNEV